MKIPFNEFEACLKGISFPFAVATSGGADSLALLLLSHELAQQKGGHIIALTVDHGLRAESHEEALKVQKWAREKGIEHIILKWEGAKPKSRLQEKAREARYALLTNWCKKNHINTILLGHHQQDQEETFWLRLSSGSGLEGLSGMKKRMVREDIVFLRPLLGFPKERLKATLIAGNQPWIEDPSNQSVQFFRGKWRTLLEKEGLSNARLLNVMEKLECDASFIHDSLQNALQTVVEVYDEGYLVLQKEAFDDLHPAIAKRLISLLMRWFSGATYSPRSHQLTTVLEKIITLSPFTAGGIYWTHRQDKIYLLREMAAIQKGFFLHSMQEETPWDQRFSINIQIKRYVPEEMFLASLGSQPSLKKEILSSIPSFIWPTLPALWVKGEVVTIPHLCYDKFKCEKDLRKFIYLKPLFHDSLRFTI